MEQNTQTVEINGVKYEIDMRGARKITAYKVGDRVKVLVKKYGNDYEVHVGAIVGIDAFQALPSVVVAYVPANAWTEPEVKFVTLNAKSTDVEIAPMCGDEIAPTRETILSMFTKARTQLELKITELDAKREYFLRRFGSTIGHVRAEAEAASAPEVTL